MKYAILFFITTMFLNCIGPFQAAPDYFNIYFQRNTIVTNSTKNILKIRYTSKYRSIFDSTCYIKGEFDSKVAIINSADLEWSMQFVSNSGSEGHEHFHESRLVSLSGYDTISIYNNSDSLLGSVVHKPNTKHYLINAVIPDGTIMNDTILITDTSDSLVYTLKPAFVQ